MGGIVLIFIFTALFGLGVALLVADPGYFSELFKGPQKTDIAPRPADFAADEELLAPLSDPAPADRATAEFTDRQLMGMILNERAPEALVKEAIDEAERRKLAGLAAALVKPLRHDGYLVRIRALEVLSTLGDKRVVPAVMGALDDHDPLVRGYAARALGTIGDKRAVPYLSARLGSETVEEVKESLRRAIDKLNGFSVKGD
jgi:HEAT repeat protein